MESSKTYQVSETRTEHWHTTKPNPTSAPTEEGFQPIWHITRELMYQRNTARILRLFLRHDGHPLNKHTNNDILEYTPPIRHGHSSL